MKTISGKVMSMQPISLSKASRYISDFASFENNGVSEVVSVYLNRCSQAFGSLVQLHKDIKNPQSSHKKRKKKSFNDQENDYVLMNDENVKSHDGERKSRRSVEVEDGVGSELRKGGQNDGNGGDENVVTGYVERSAKKKTKKEKREEKSENIREGFSVGNAEDENMVNAFVDGTTNKKKREKEKEEGENKNIEQGLKMEVEHKKKKKKKKRGEIEMKDMEEEGNLEGKKKKRKSVDLDDKLQENSAEQTRKKRKKSKVLNDA